MSIPLISDRLLNQQSWVDIIQARGREENGVVRDINEFDNRANVLRLCPGLIDKVAKIEEVMDVADPSSVRAAHVALDALIEI